MSLLLMKLHTLKRSTWIISKSKRLGRGNSSWKGNYSTKGHKWQKARSGASMKPFFEGWQTSIVQRIPKARGFKRYFKLIKEVVTVNLGHLDADERITDGMEISKSLLKEFGYIKKDTSFVKVLGNGDWTKKVTFVDIDAFSKSAQEKIEKPAAKKAPAAKAEAKPATKKPVAKKAPAAKAEAKPAAKKPAAKKAPAAKAEAKPAAKKTSTKKEDK